MSEHKASLQKCTWADVREAVARVNPGLAAVIDDIDPGPEYVLWRAKYPYGATILHGGKLRIPSDNGGYLPINSNEIKSNIRESLAYAGGMPMGVLLDKQLELFWSRMNEFIPTLTMQPGRVFGCWGHMSAPEKTIHFGGNLWWVSSGARSLFFLPKIAEKMGYKRLKKQFGLKTPLPKTFDLQYELLTELANTPSFPQAWHSDVLFFGSQWQKMIASDDTSWLKLKFYLLNAVWLETTYARDKDIYHAAFSRALSAKNLKPDPYHTDLVKYIFAQAMGNAPAYKIANNDIAAPVSSLQKIFVEVFGLKSLPHMAHYTMHNSTDNAESVYYSLAQASLIAYSPRGFKDITRMSELRDIKYLQETVCRYLMKEDLGIESTILHDMLSNKSFDYFHNGANIQDEIANSKTLLALDPHLQQDAATFTDLVFPHASPFFRGCIKMATKK